MTNPHSNSRANGSLPFVRANRKLETAKSYIQFIKNEKKLLDEQRSKVQEEAGVEDDGLDSIGSNRLETRIV